MSGWRLRLLFFIALLAVWEALFRLRLWPSYVFPSMSSVGASLVAGIADGSYPLAIAVSLRRILVGYGLSLAIGIPLGLLLGRVKSVQDTLGSIVLGPAGAAEHLLAAVGAVVVRAFGEGDLFVVVMGAVLSVTLSTADGVHNTPPLYLRAARTMGARGLRLYTGVILPAALPAILSGMKLGWSFAWRSLMAGELLYVSLGLGQLLDDGPRVERHEPGHCRDVGHHCDRAAGGSGRLCPCRAARPRTVGVAARKVIRLIFVLTRCSFRLYNWPIPRPRKRSQECTGACVRGGDCNHRLAGYL